MTPERRAKLESLEGWDWDPLTSRWNKGFEELTKYASNEGSSLVPQSYNTSEGYPLGSWVSKLRRNKERLTSDQLARVESLIGWDWDPFSTRWNIGFEELTKYIALHGSARVPHKYVTSEGYNLGTWITTQRANKGKLPEDRRRRLEEIGFRF